MLKRGTPVESRPHSHSFSVEKVDTVNMDTDNLLECRMINNLLELCTQSSDPFSNKALQLTLNQRIDCP